VARRRAAGVVGDGVRTVGQLIGQLNDDPRRGSQRYSLLKTLVIDDDLGDCLFEQGLTPDAVPPAGQAVWLSRVANISSGGTAEDVTGITHPDNAALATRAARIIGLDIAGVDFLCPDISRSWREVGGVICEVNAQPGFRPHWLADPDRDINGEILEMLFGGRPARIPTAAITGTNGKTTTAEMLYRIWTVAGRITGVCTTARVRIGDQIVSTDNLSGQPGARIILNDPAVEAAVLEMPRKGMIYFGHHCDRYDVAALLNVRDDHIGADGIETLEQMAELKAEVIERATAAIVVNADDPLCMAMRSRAGTDRHILVTEHPASVADHRRQGGEAVFSAERDGERWMVLCAGGDETPVLPMRDIPATMNGLMRVNESNAMFAAALAWAQGIGVATIREALSSFDASPETNPGRFNFIDDLPFTLLLDYAHNPDGVQELCSFVAKFPAAGRRILCARSLGNHSAAQFAEVAPLLARTFDEFFLSCVVRYVVKCPDYAGADPVGTMLAMSRQRLLEQTVAAESVVCVPDPDELLANCFAVARPGDLVVVLGNYYKLVEQIEDYRRALPT
ncbi:MAG: cyanophycin synthetase, partial [Mycobacterium sp.]|nr:cyanophycin synthetase [Mycobacterium sp.]